MPLLSFIFLLLVTAPGVSAVNIANIILTRERSTGKTPTLLVQSTLLHCLSDSNVGCNTTVWFYHPNFRNRRLGKRALSLYGRFTQPSGSKIWAIKLDVCVSTTIIYRGTVRGCLPNFLPS